MHGPVLSLPPALFFITAALAGGRSHICFLESFPNDIHRHIARMAEVSSVETIIAQLVHHNLITREIIHMVAYQVFCC